MALMDRITARDIARMIIASHARWRSQFIAYRTHRKNVSYLLNRAKYRGVENDVRALLFAHSMGMPL